MKVDGFRMCFLMDFCLFVLISAVVCQPTQSNNGFYRGRHVCAQRQQVTYQAPITQSYRRPVYRPDLGRTVFQTAYRTVLRMKLGDKLVPACCPGWKKRTPRDASCLEPVCKEPCENGRCIRPGICICDKGYSGYRCDKDINECLGRHRCQQSCINTNGTYECACQEGFKLGDDNMSCVLCLTCTKEFQSMQEKLLAMNSKIEQLESEKENLQQTVTSALTQYDEAMQALHVVSPMTSAPKTTTPDPNIGEPYMPLDRLASLSEQISILEEKMASCMCGHDDYMMG